MKYYQKCSQFITERHIHLSIIGLGGVGNCTSPFPFFIVLSRVKLYVPNEQVPMVITTIENFVTLMSELTRTEPLREPVTCCIETYSDKATPSRGKPM